MKYGTCGEAWDAMVKISTSSLELAIAEMQTPKIKLDKRVFEQPEKPLRRHGHNLR